MSSGQHFFWPSSFQCAFLCRQDEQGLSSGLDALPCDDHLTHIIPGRKLEHDVAHDRFDDRAQATGTCASI